MSLSATSAISCLQRLVYKTTRYVSSQTLNSAHLLSDLCFCVLSLASVFRHSTVLAGRPGQRPAVKMPLPYCPTISFKISARLPSSLGRPENWPVTWQHALDGRRLKLLNFRVAVIVMVYFDWFVDF